MGYNPAIQDGTHYLAGREDLDGSLRFTVDTVTGFTEVQCRLNGVWQPADFETGPRSLWLGRNVGVASIGKHMATETADGTLHFHAHSKFDGETSVTDTQIIRATTFQGDVEAQPDQSGDWSGTSFEYSNPVTAHTLLSKLVVKTGAVAASSPVRFQIWAGTDDTGELLFDQTYPIATFAANSDAVLLLAGHTEYEAGVDVFTRISSDDAFSLKTNAAVTFPYYKVDYSTLTEDNLLQTAEWVDGATWAEGDHFIDSRKIYISNVAGTQTGTFAANANKWNSLGDVSRFARNALTTGLVSGGLITPTSGTTLDISSGEGIVADYSDPHRPLPTLVTWDQVTGYTPTNIGVDGQYVLGIDASGTLVEIDVADLTAQDVRDYVIVGGIGIQSGAIAAVITAPVNVGVNGINTAKDFIRDVVGPANIIGNDISANGANLSLNNSGGLIFITGANYRNNPEVPDEKAVPPATPMTFLRFYRAAAPSEEVIIDPVGPTTVIDPTRWDDGSGTLATITGNRFSVQVAYIGPNGNHYVAYGQELFNTAALAEEAVHGGTLFYDEHPTPLKFVRRAFIIVKNSTTDLTSATFLMDGKFRMGGILTGAIELHSSLQNLEWDVAGHTFDDAGVMDIGDYDLVTNTVRSEFGLHINPDSPGDVRFFDGDDVADTVDGKRVYVYRRAVEGDSFISLYVHRDQQAHINSNVDIILSQGTSNALIITEADHVVNAPFGLKSSDVTLTGKLGVGTSSVPHAGIGMAKFAMDGANADATGPHIQVTTAADDYPLFQMLNWQHDDISLNFDAYNTATGWMSSDIGSCFQIQKNTDKFKIRVASGITPGTAIGAWWIDALVITPDGVVDAPFAGLKSKGVDVLTAETDPVFTAWDRSTGISITESQISDLDHFTNSDETDPVFMAWDRSTGIAITVSQVTDHSYSVADLTELGVNRVPYGSSFGGLNSNTNFTYISGNLSVPTSLNVPEISNVAGLLKIQPDVQGDVELFGDTDVGDAVNGKMLYVRRQAVEGDDYIRLYVSHAMTGVISASSDLTAFAEGSITLQSAAENIICRMGDDAGAKGTYFKNNSNAIVGSVDSLGNAQFNVSIDVPEISNTAGLLKIQPDVQGDVELFGDTDVDNADSGKILKVWRRAPEGNDYIRFYIGASRAAYIHASNALTMQGQVAFTINSVTRDINFKVGDNAGVRKVYFKDSDGVDVATVDSNGKAWFKDRLEAQKLYVHQDNEVLAQFTRNNDSESGTVAAGILLGVRSYPDGETIQNKGGVFFVRTGGYGRGDLVLCVNGTPDNSNASLADEVLRLSDGHVTVSGTLSTSGLINDGVTRYNRGETQPYHYDSWDCMTARYKQKFGLVTWGSGPHDSAWSPDGKKVFIVDNTDEEIYEFAVPVPWDVSSMTTPTYTMSTTSEESNPQGLCFNLDGTKMYVVGSGGDEVNMYTLSSPWTLSTATPTNLKDLSGNSGTPTCVRFRPDGLMMFIGDGSLDEVQAWTLTTAWDVTSATYTTKFDASMDNIEGFSFSPDGHRLYVVDGSTEDDIHEYELGTPWDITTGVHTRSLDLTNTADVPNSVTFSPDGRKMYVTDNDSGIDALLEFDMGIRCEGLIHAEQLVIGEPTQITPWLLPLEVVSADNVQGNFHDSRAQAAGTGGGFAFTGHYTDAGDMAFCVEFGAEKVNSISGDYGFDFVLKTQKNGGSLTEVLRGLSVGGVKIIGPLQVDRITTTERDALTAVNGMIIYNTTTGAFNFREGGAWVTK